MTMGIIEEHAAESNADFLIYTGNFCPYCTGVKRFLKQMNLRFKEFNMDSVAGMREEVVGQTGHRTVPVVIDNRGEQPIFIGGFDETRAYLS